MKKKRKLISILLSIFMVFMLIPVGVFADGAPATSGSCGENVRWELNNGTLTISGSGEMENYPGPIAPWHSRNCDEIRTIIIEDGITSIGSEAFADCSGLTSITIPDSVTSIRGSAFYGCSGLRSITIPNSVTSIGYRAFYGCSGLRSITIPDSVTSIEDEAFCDCSGLRSITIPGSVTFIGCRVFDGCSELRSITISDGVTSIGDEAFVGCSGLTSVTIPGSVTSIGDEAFVGCSGLTSVTIPGSVTSIGAYAFYGCSGLTSVTIPGSVTSIGYAAFADCSGLTSITISDGVTSIWLFAFADCSGLTSITIPDSVTHIEHSAFNGCNNLTNINVTPNNKNYCSEDNILLNKTKKIIVRMPEGNSISNYNIPESVTSIGDGAFGGCSGLTSITIPENVTSIGDFAFGGCSGLTSITIPESVTSIGDSAFYGCSGLTSITIPESVTSIGDFAFGGCSELTSITIPESVTSIGDSAFRGCSGLTSITIPESVTSIGNSAFGGCSGLTSITIPESVTFIGGFAFEGCSGLTSVTIPKSVTWISSDAFKGCNQLKDVYYSGTEAEWKEIGNKPSEFTSATIHYNSIGPDNPSEEPDDPIGEGTFGFEFCKKDSSYPSEKNAEFVVIGDKISLKGIIQHTIISYDLPTTQDGDTEQKKEHKDLAEIEKEFSEIEWKVSDPSVIELGNIVLDRNEQSLPTPLKFHYYGWSLSVKGLKPGKATITGTTSDGRTTCWTISVEPDMTLEAPETISGPSTVICKVSLPQADPEYLKSYLSSLKMYFEYKNPKPFPGGATDTPDGKGYFSCKLNEGDKSYTISADGKSAVYNVSVSPTGSGSHPVTISLSSPSGHKASADSNIVLSESSFLFKYPDGTKDNRSTLRSMEWDDDFNRYTPDEIEAELEVTFNPEDKNSTMKIDTVTFGLTGDLSKYVKISGESEIKVNRTLSAGESFTQPVKLVKKGMFWKKLEKGESITGKITAKLEMPSDVSGIAKEHSLTVNISNPRQAVPDQPIEDEEEKKINQEIVDAASDAADEIIDTNLNDKLGLPLLGQFLSKNPARAAHEEEALGAFIYAGIAMANMSEDNWDVSKLSDKCVEKVMDKFLGDWNPKLSMKVRDIPLEIIVNTDRGAVTFRFDCHITDYLMGSKPHDPTSFAISGAIDTTVIQDDQTYPLARAIFNKADIGAFAKAGWEVASAELKMGYKQVWGNDVDKVMNHIFPSSIDSLAEKAAAYGLKKPVQQILSAYYEKKFKDKTADKIFDFLVYPSKLSVAKCPVDLFIYNSSNELVGSIEDDAVTRISDGMSLWTEGDDKYAQLFDDNYRIEYRSTDTGTMNLYVYDKASGLSDLRVCSFKEVPLRTGLNYEQSINNITLTDPINYQLTSNEDTVIKSDSEDEIKSNDSLPLEQESSNPSDNPGENTGTSSGGGGGGGGSVPSSDSDKIIVDSSVSNGKVTVDKATAKKGDTVTITAVPDEGYVTDKVTVTDKDGKEISVKDNGDGKYSFTKPEGAVKISAVFKKEQTQEPPVNPGMNFTDVRTGDWFYDAVKFVLENGLFKGVSDTEFAPGSQMTRAMFVTVLSRVEGIDAGKYGSAGFKDVPDNTWYSDAVSWASKNQIVTGYDEKTFGPNDRLTREQIAAILYRYAKYKGYDVSKTADLSGFKDVSSVSGYALESMRWANAAGLINGVGANTLNPKGDATRAQAAALLMRFCQNVK